MKYRRLVIYDKLYHCFMNGMITSLSYLRVKFVQRRANVGFHIMWRYAPHACYYTTTKQTTRPWNEQSNSQCMHI